ncbi:MAG: NTP transferase domain-containing protein [bacterium]
MKIERSPWVVTLAGGSGVRLRSLVRRQFGEERPKQYCSFVGGRSLLQHALDRADRLTAWDRQVVVIREEHLEWFRCQAPAFEGRILTEPSDRGTLPALYAALALIREIDPVAGLLVQPSDGFYHPERRLLRQLRYAMDIVPLLEDRILLAGVTPVRPDERRLWIQPGEALGKFGGNAIRRVEGVLPRPSPPLARRLQALGAVVETGLMTGSVRTFWKLAQRDSRYMLKTLSAGGLEATEEGTLRLAGGFSSVPRRDIEEGILMRGTRRLACMRLRGFLWGDWDTEADIERSLRSLDQEHQGEPVRAE